MPDVCQNRQKTYNKVEEMGRKHPYEASGSCRGMTANRNRLWVQRCPTQPVGGAEKPEPLYIWRTFLLKIKPLGRGMTCMTNRERPQTAAVRFTWPVQCHTSCLSRHTTGYDKWSQALVRTQLTRASYTEKVGISHVF